MKNLIIALFAVVALSACSSGSSTDGGGGGGGGPTKPARPATCEEAWDMQVAANPEGQVAEYQISTAIAGGAPNKSKEKLTVIESDEDHIKTRTEANGQASESTITSDAMIEACEQNGGPLQVPDGVEILEERGESITVKAGKFDVLYVKASMSNETGNYKVDAIIEAWTQGALEIKTSTTSTTVVDGQTPVVSTSVRELIKLKRKSN